MTRLNQAYGADNPLQDVFPQPVIAKRVPATSDKRFPVGQVWVDKSTDQSWMMTSVAAGSATWSLLGPGASDVDTINSLSPTAGNMIIDGGTNVTDVNAGSTVTLNLDAAITLATSVTSPLYTASAADVAISAPASQDVVLKLGDNAGANKLSVLDSDDVEVFAVDSNGGQTYTTITASGLITGNASATILTAGTALTLAADNSADAVILGGGTSARAITIGQDAAAHTITIGQAAAGAIAVDTAAGVSIDAAAASNFTVAGAGIDLTLDSGAGRVIINGEEAAANAITLLSAAGGVDLDAALQVNIASSQNAADAVRISASAGGIDVDAVGAAGEDINITNTGGSVVVSATEAIADSIKIESTAGGIDVLASAGGAGLDIDITNTGGSINLSATESAADAIKVESTAGGVQILASGAAAGEDIVLTATGSSVIVTSTESAVDAVKVEATAGGIQLLASGAAAGEDILLTATGSSVIVTSTEDDTGAIYLHANGGTSERIRLHSDQGTAADSVLIDSDAGGVTITSGTDITLNGTVKEVNSEFAYSTGTDLVVTQSPICQSALTTAVAPTGTAADVNLAYLQDGSLLEYSIIGTQTILAPRMSANGLAIELDNTNGDGVEYGFGPRNNAKHSYVIGTDAAFFGEMKLKVADLSGCAPLMIGFRKVEAYNTVLADYTDYFCAGINTATSITQVALLDELNAGGQTATNSTDNWGSGDGTSSTIRVLVSASGVCTYTIDGGAPSATNAMTFDNGDNVMFFCYVLNGADVAGEVALESLKVGYQA